MARAGNSGARADPGHLCKPRIVQAASRNKEASLRHVPKSCTKSTIAETAINKYLTEEEDFIFILFFLQNCNTHVASKSLQRQMVQTSISNE